MKNRLLLISLLTLVLSGSAGSTLFADEKEKPEERAREERKGETAERRGEPKPDRPQPDRPRGEGEQPSRGPGKPGPERESRPDGPRPAGHGPEEPAPGMDREIAELHRMMGEAQRDRNPERAREIEARIRALHQERAEHARREGPPRDEFEAHIHHLRVAAENLERAGRGDQAHALREEAERMEHERNQHRGPEGRDERVRHLEAEIRELHEIVGDLRREMERLREELGERRR